MEDFDIYADLPSFNVADAENENKEDTCKKYEEKNQLLEKENSLLKIKLSELEGLNNKLKCNFSSLIKTAKAEISRKDRTINDLRAQLDNMTFRRNPPYRNNMHARNNHVSHYPSPSPLNAGSTHKEKQYQRPYDYNNQAQPVVNHQSVKEETSVIHTKQCNADNESDDAVTNKSEYRKTVYGERLRKKLQEEMENEIRRKAELSKKEGNLIKQDEEPTKREENLTNQKEEPKNPTEEAKKNEVEAKIKNECLDKVNNKENLAFINEVDDKVDSNTNSEKSSDPGSICKDYKNTETKLPKTVDSTETKTEQCTNKKNDITKINKYFVANGNIGNAANKNSSGNYKKYHNDSTVYKEYRNRDDYNHQDRHSRYVEGMHTDLNSRHSRKDKYYKPFERNDRRRSSHSRYKSRDRESCSSSGKDDVRKKHCKSTEEKYDHESKRVYKKDSKHVSKQDKLYKRDREDKSSLHDLEINKKHKEHKASTPSRKRHSESVEKMLHENKRKKVDIKNTVDRMSIDKVKRNSVDSNEIVQHHLDKVSKTLKIDDDAGDKNTEHLGGNSKLNFYKIEVKQDRNLGTEKFNGKFTADNVVGAKDLDESNRNTTAEKEINASEEESNGLEKAAKKETEGHVEGLSNEIEEGEIVMSPNDELKNVSKIDVKMETTRPLAELKLSSEIGKNVEISNTGDNLEVKDLSEGASKNKRPSETDVEPKKDEDKTTNIENKLLFTLLTQDIQKQRSAQAHYACSEAKEDAKENLLVEKWRMHCDKKSGLVGENVVDKAIDNANPNVDKEKDGETKGLACTLQMEFMEDDDSAVDDDDPKLQVIENDELMDEKDEREPPLVNRENDKEASKLRPEKYKVNKFYAERSESAVNDDTKDEEINVNNYISNEVLKPLVNSAVPSTDGELESSLSKKMSNASKSQAVKNIIIVRRRRRPVQLSDSPPVLVITQNGESKTT